ncbi:nucleotide-binding universal stress protein, UspA family [Thermodesulfovibrio aggregans]|uniref:Nucleotide-binding universal stress protein, UspA family n=1 Tax=Thermodesulfovibrio aggregans TaxID=86166 RepID=A0A0U9HLB1_9BACT|nr:universal stress protein [Thermodesulfovibrio aggregans]GAQ93875.1 nucleotide-binding universal stress protein, UspA family [Thermodesulfovibrio aggregans]
MAIYKRILACIDGSDESFHTFEEAVRFAKERDITVFALTVAPSYHGDLSLVGIGVSIEEISKPYKETLSKAKDIAEKHQVLVKTLYEEGEPFEKIIDVSEEISSDLIVMGKKGISALQQVLMGSVTERVIGYSNTDVLVVPKNSTIKWNKCLVAVDVSKYGEKVCSKAIDIARDFQSEINLISAVEVPLAVFAVKPELYDEQVNKTKKYLKELELKFHGENISPRIFIEEGEPYKKILEKADQIQADIIVVGSHGRTGLKRLLMGSTCQRVIGLSKVPVLVVKS